jgi:hypothetical protein
MTIFDTGALRLDDGRIVPDNLYAYKSFKG